MELSLLHAELDKQRDRFGRKESSKNTRALVLVGASTILGGFVTSGADSTWRIAAGVVAVTAVLLGILAMRPSRGDEIVMAKLEKEIRDADSYRAELILYRSKLKAHRSDLLHLGRRSLLVTIGYWLLIGGLVAGLIPLLSAKIGLL